MTLKTIMPQLHGRCLRVWKTRWAQVMSTWQKQHPRKDACSQCAVSNSVCWGKWQRCMAGQVAISLSLSLSLCLSLSLSVPVGRKTFLLPTFVLLSFKWMGTCKLSEAKQIIRRRQEIYLPTLNYSWVTHWIHRGKSLYINPIGKGEESLGCQWGKVWKVLLGISWC
jgi:hypothetical protein